MSLNKNIPIAVTMGEPGGINSELIIKTYKNTQIPNFFLIADPDWIEKSLIALKLKSKINIISCPEESKKGSLNIFPISNKVRFGFKKSYQSNVLAIIESLDIAIKLALNKKVEGIVTLPILKETLIKAGFKYPGHTEYLGEKTASKPLMILFNEKIKVASLTTHIPIRKVSEKITKKSICDAIKIMNNSLKNDFGIANPKIVISSLNPHGGEGGTIGSEEIDIIIPSIIKMKSLGLDVYGPISADTLFSEPEVNKYDAKICMFHDQALIPVKTLDFYGTVNFTAGLPIVRTSPDHGTALNIAGEKEANNLSLRKAITFASKISKNRKRNEKRI